MSVVIIVVSEGYVEGQEISQKVYEVQVSILHEIATNDLNVETILEVDEEEVSWEEFEGEGLEGIRDKIVGRTPNYLECKAKICPDLTCEMTRYPDKTNIYVQYVLIKNSTSIEDKYMQLFCWIV